MIKTLKKIIKFFGIENQKIKAIEELSELIKAICKEDRDNIIEELADVEIMIEQIKLIYKINNSDIFIVKVEKLERVKSLIK